MIDTLLMALEPHLIEILSGILIWLFGLFVVAVRQLSRKATEMIGRHLGLEAERIWRETLHRALQSGVLATEGVADEQLRIEQVIRYALRSSPDAIRELDPPDDLLRDLARAKIREVEGSPRPAARSRAR
jgi:hypothetical protein